MVATGARARCMMHASSVFLLLRLYAAMINQMVLAMGAFRVMYNTCSLMGTFGLAVEATELYVEL